MSTQSPRKIHSSPLSDPLLQLCQKLREFLAEQVQRKTSNLPLAESLELTPAGELCVRKRLEFGIVLLAIPNQEDPRIVTLQIFFDPALFKAWREGLGPVTQLYLNPYGLELVLDHKVNLWGLFLDGKELHMDLETGEIYEVAKLEIHDGRVLRTA